MTSLRLSSASVRALSGKTVFCGFSGGADSLALLLLLSESAEALSFSLTAVHFEHGFRGRESLLDAEFCAKTCERLKIPFRRFSLNVPESKAPGEGDEGAARRLRMEMWKKLISQEGTGKSRIALGHHAEDAEENVLLRLFRGSNASGLASFSEVDETGGIPIVRPLFSRTRMEIEAFLRERGESWRTDSTNLREDYGRNFLRGRILPEIEEKFPYARAGILRSLSVLAEDSDFLESLAQTGYARLSEKNFSPEEWRTLPPALFCRILRRFLTGKLGREYIPGHDLIERFRSMILSPPESGFRCLELPGTAGARVYAGRDCLRFLPPPEDSVCLWRWRKEKISFRGSELSSLPGTDLGSGADSAAFDPALLPEILTVRKWKPGDRMIPFGGTVSVSVRKLLSDAGVPLPEKTVQCVVCLPDGTILWIPGVRRSNSAPVSGSTDRGIVFSVRKEWF